MVFNATFNNISVISWRSGLLVEETGVPWGKPSTCHKSLTNFITWCCRVLLAMNTINQPLKTFWGHIKKPVLTCILIRITFLSKFYHTFVGCAENINKIMMKAAMPARDIKLCGLFHTDVMMITIIPITTAVIHNLKNR